MFRRLRDALEETPIRQGAQFAFASLSAIGRFVLSFPNSLQKAVRFIEPWGISLAVIGLLLALIAFLIELEDRQSERIFRAWDVVLKSEASRASGGSARQALEYLNREYDGWGCGILMHQISLTFTGVKSRECLIPRKRRESFISVQLPKAILVGANLEGAILDNANLASSSLAHSNLRGASLAGVNLESVNLYGADLSFSDFDDTLSFISDIFGATGPRLENTNLQNALLAEANLSDADLGRTLLTGAILTQSDVSGARLASVIGLTQEMLDRACGARPPATLPKDLSWRSQRCERHNLETEMEFPIPETK